MSARRSGLITRLRPDWYLILILAMATLASLAPVRGEAAPAFGLAIKFAIGLVFFLHGARLSRDAVIGGLTHWRLHLVVLAATFALFPALTFGLGALPAWITPPALVTGIVLLGCLPSTIQSSVGFTAIARGNVAAAVAAASASNLLGMALTPLLATLLLHAEGSLSPGTVQAILLQLLVPFLAGQLVQPLIGTWARARAKMLTLVDRGAIMLVVYVTFSSAVVDGVWGRLGPFDLLRLLLICSALLAIVLATARTVSRALSFPTVDEIAVLFCGSKKSLASGAAMVAALLPAASAGVALIPLMIFHQIQLMACAVIAQRYSRRPDIEAQTS